jgi:hypothetical protein
LQTETCPFFFGTDAATPSNDAPISTASSYSEATRVASHFSASVTSAAFATSADALVARLKFSKPFYGFYYIPAELLLSNLNRTFRTLRQDWPLTSSLVT